MAMLNVSLKAMRYIMVACLVCMVILVFSNVVLRYLFNSSIYIAEGVSSLLFVWMTFVGAALVIYERGLIAVDVLICRFPRFPRFLCETFVDVVMLAIAVLFLKGSWHQMILNLNIMSSSTLLPSALLYAAGVFFSLASGFFLILRLAGSVAVAMGFKAPSKKPEAQVQE